MCAGLSALCAYAATPSVSFHAKAHFKDKGVERRKAGNNKIADWPRDGEKEIMVGMVSSTRRVYCGIRACANFRARKSIR